jgi:hypothetical protein
MSLLDADRLAKLAGLPVSDRGSLNEGGNRSYHEDADPEGIAEWRYGKNNLNEDTDDDDDEDYTTKKSSKRKKGGKKGKPFWGGKRGDKKGADEGSEKLPLKLEGGEIVEIDERMIMAEIARMRKERLQENELRNVIRAEIGSILKDLKSKHSSSSSQAHRPNRGGRGITMGALGPGFR